MATKLTAGILVYRIRDNVLQVLLAHSGGPFWARKEDHAWSIFKGEPDEGEDLLAAAKREFAEETAQIFPEDHELLPLGESKLSDGKIAHIWAMEHDYDPAAIRSNNFEMQWPPKSGRMQEFPENDRAAWFDAAEAPEKMFKGQSVFVERLYDNLHARLPELRTEGPDGGSSVQPSLF